MTAPHHEIKHCHFHFYPNGQRKEEDNIIRLQDRSEINIYERDDGLNIVSGTSLIMKFGRDGRITIWKRNPEEHTEWGDIGFPFLKTTEYSDTFQLAVTDD